VNGYRICQTVLLWQGIMSKKESGNVSYLLKIVLFTIYFSIRLYQYWNYSHFIPFLNLRIMFKFKNSQNGLFKREKKPFIVLYCPLVFKIRYAYWINIHTLGNTVGLGP